MSKLIHMVKGVLFEEYTLERGTLYIGRAADNDIRLTDKNISEHHARISIDSSPYRDGADDVFVIDLDSKNGTIVNGTTITRHRLIDRDVIKIGLHRLKFMDDTASGEQRTVILADDKD